MIDEARELSSPNSAAFPTHRPAGISRWGAYSRVYSEVRYIDDLGHAPVLHPFLDENGRANAKIVQGWRVTLDSLLIIAGIFSSIVSTFVVYWSYVAFRPKYARRTVTLLTEFVNTQYILATGGNIVDETTPQAPVITLSGPFQTSSRSLWLQGLWSFSLGLTLSIVLIATLTRQWLHYHESDAFVESPRDTMDINDPFPIRQLGHFCTKPLIISTLVESLPVLMNVALLLFAMGSLLFLGQITLDERTFNAKPHFSNLGPSMQ